MPTARPSRRRAAPPAPPEATPTGTGRPLPLLAQYDYTFGGCPSFARAALRVLGGRPALLFALDPRQFEEHDHPKSVPLCLHAFVLTDEGLAIDAEGIRTVEDLARGFGVRRGWRYRIAEGQAELDRQFPTIRPEYEAEAAKLMEDHGWRGGVPSADESLKKNWRKVTAMSEERFRPKRKPTAAQLRLYGLVPGHRVDDWHRFDRLEVRHHDNHGFVVVAVPTDHEDEVLLLAATGDRDDADEIGCGIELDSGLTFEIGAMPRPV